MPNKPTDILDAPGSSANKNADALALSTLVLFLVALFCSVMGMYFILKWMNHAYLDPYGFFQGGRFWDFKASYWDVLVYLMYSRWFIGLRLTLFYGVLLYVYRYWLKKKDLIKLFKQTHFILLACTIIIGSLAALLIEKNWSIRAFVLDQYPNVDIGSVTELQQMGWTVMSYASFESSFYLLVLWLFLRLRKLKKEAMANLPTI